MNYSLYVVYDKKSNLFSVPFTSINDNTATREFLETYSNYYFKEDLSLFKVGSYDSSSAILTSLDKPQFITDYNMENDNEK